MAHHTYSCSLDNILPLAIPPVCTDGEPRLVGGLNEIEGTVEICYNQTYWTVCDDHWDEMDSSIVCRQLGYNAEGKINIDLHVIGLRPL